MMRQLSFEPWETSLIIDLLEGHKARLMDEAERVHSLIMRVMGQATGKPDPAQVSVPTRLAQAQADHLKPGAMDDQLEAEVEELKRREKGVQRR